MFLHHQDGIRRIETRKLRGDDLVRAARDGRIARLDRDPVRHGRFYVTREHEQGGSGMPQIRRTEGDQGDRGCGHGGDRRRIASHRLPLDPLPVFDGSRLFDRFFDQLSHQRLRMRRRRVPPGFDGADDRRLQGRLVLLEIHRHLLVGHPPQQRSNEQIRDQRRDCRGQDDAEGDDGLGREACRLERAGRHDEDDQAEGCDPHRTAQRQFRAPAAAHLLDHPEEFSR